MQTITTIGLDIAKSVFQVLGVDGAGQVVIRRQLKRRSVLAFFQKLPPCLVGIEACASAHHWSRELQALGHKVRLIPPAYVKPYVKRQKNDAADAEAICEAVTRATMRFVPTKTPEQQSGLGPVDSKDSLLSANQVQGCFWEAALGVMDRLVLSDVAWERMAPLIICRPDQKGATGRDNRMFVEGVLWIVRTGSPWRDLPEAFGDWNSVFRRFSRWSIKGVWYRIFEAMSDDPDFEYLIIDSTIVRAHQHAAGAKKGGLKIRRSVARAAA